MESAPQSNPQLSGNVLFYTQPEPLSFERHGNLGVKRLDKPFKFLRKAHAIPVTITEFGMVAGSYPVIFVGDDKAPIAVMGARADENIFVDDAGDPDPDVYLPAFSRRYPFVFAADENSERLVLCVDRNAEIVGENPDIPFFEGNETSQYTKDAMEFCKEFERQRQASAEFVKILDELGLFETKSVSFTPRMPDGSEGEPQKIADYWAISEERLNALPQDKYLELRDKGILGGVYAHMVSLLHWPKIIQRTIRLSPENQAVNPDVNPHNAQ